MSAAREELKEALCRYVKDTLIYINTVKAFWDRSSKWELQRETEQIMMMDIKDRLDGIDLSIDHVKSSENRGKAFSEYLKSKVTQVTADSRRSSLEEELAAVLKGTLGGLEELHHFLDAVEKLAVTSLHVFTGSQVLPLPEGTVLERVQDIVTAARQISPLLLEFKRDAQLFFLPRLQNMEVLLFQLDKYIQTTHNICKKLEKGSFYDFHLKTAMETVVNLEVDVYEGDIQKMLYHVNQLNDIRKNQNFRLVFLFQEETSCRNFMHEFSERQPRMLQFLTDLEETAVQLDSMSKGAKISSVVGSSVGAVGGVLSIVGLALIPVTAGVSLALTMTGIGLGIGSGLNSAVTTITEIGVNSKHQNKASETFHSFMRDVQSIQDCLEEVTKRETSKVDVAMGVGKVLCKASTIIKGIDSLVDGASVAKVLKTEELITGAGKILAEEGKALRNVPRVASDLPDIGQAAVKGPLALSKTARAGLITLNALFLGMDIFFICKDSISLARGTETQFSLFLRARAALWSSEMDTWQQHHDSLSQGLQTYEKNEAILETPFYPETDAKNQKDSEIEILSEVDTEVK